jgi:hypothetical protein
LYRGSDFEKTELEHAKQYFFCTNRRPEIQAGDLVIGRYSLLPFYSDQEADINFVGAKLINNLFQHIYIADLQNYVSDLEDLTPRTWNQLHTIPEQGPFILKGETNSRKSDWKHSMYAEDKKAAIRVHSQLSNDSLIGHQKIYIRSYVPLVKYMDGVNGMPVTKEFRFFVAYDTVLCGAYYWQNYVDEISEVPSADEVPKDFLNEVIKRVDGKSNFYVIDVAQTESGEWIVIELNDGQQSGLSCNDPATLYKNLKNVLVNKGL